MTLVRIVVSACILSVGMLLTVPVLAGAQARHAHAAAAPLVVGSPDSEDVRALPVDARPALSQRIEPVANWLEHEPKNIAVLGHECPDGWTARKTADGKMLYVPLGLLVDETGAPRTAGPGGETVGDAGRDGAGHGRAVGLRTGKMTLREADHGGGR